MVDTDLTGEETLDDVFLASLDEWRLLLAENIALRNKDLSEEAINFLVQSTINCIVFLRNSEDRKVEFYGRPKDCIRLTSEEGQLFTTLQTLLTSQRKV